MKVLIDMNLREDWINHLAASSLPSVHWKELGSPAAADTSIFDYAAAQALCILTCDLDFGTLLAATRAAKPSVVQLRLTDVRPERSGARVATLIDTHRAPLEQGALLIISDDRIRLRPLPIG